jgi:hypothetical protein
VENDVAGADGCERGLMTIAEAVFINRNFEWMYCVIG